MPDRLDTGTLALIRRLLAGLTLLIGLMAVAFGAYWLNRQHDFLATAAVAEGRVIANNRVDWTSRSSGSGMSRHAYRAIVQFTDRVGQRITLPDFFAFNPSSFSVGQKVKVFYDPHSPQHAWIDRGNKERYLLLLISALGTLLIVSAVRTLWRGNPTLLG
jgi:hypothetical protein